MFRRFSGLTAALMVSLLAAPAMARKYTIVSEPVRDGRIFVNGEFVGVAPVEVDLKIKDNQTVVVTADKDGSISDWPRRIDPKQKGAVVVRLESDESFQATEESDVANTWITVAPFRSFNDDGKIDEDKTWQKLISLVTDNFSDLEQMDRASYYIRSAWRVREYPFRVLRHRLLVKRGVGEDFTIRISIESQIAPRGGGGYRDEDFQPTRRVYRKDKETMDFLRDQL